MNFGLTFKFAFSKNKCFRSTHFVAPSIVLARQIMDHWHQIKTKCAQIMRKDSNYQNSNPLNWEPMMRIVKSCLSDIKNTKLFNA